jgi:acyl-CoA synthetase (AMP-forming)/AMP-acid ligase II
LRCGRVGPTATYRDLAAEVRAVAAQLPVVADPARPRPVGIVMRNDRASVVYFLAVISSGAAAVVLSPDVPAARRAEQVAAAGCELELEPGPTPAGTGDDPMPSGPRSIDDPAIIVFTSGTTASSKAVVQTHYNVLVNTTATVRHHRLDVCTRMLCCLPLHHVNGLHFTILSTLLAGAHVLLCDHFDPRSYLQAAHEHDVHVGSVVPSILEALLDTRRAPELPHLRYLVSAAAPLHATTARKVHDRLGLRIAQGYGLTETMNFSTTMPLDLQMETYERLMLEREIPPVGAALWGNEVAILDDAGAELHAGAQGELCVRGHSVMWGYLDNPEATRLALAGGWFHTGDLASADDEAIPGRRVYTVTGRTKNIVKVAGEGISLDELDRALLAVDGVRDVVSFGVPDPVLGEVPVVVIAADGVGDGALNSALAARFPIAHHPREFVRVPAIPRMPNGKVDRRRVREVSLTETR